MLTIPLFLTPPHSCSYLSDKQAQALFVHSSLAMNNAMYEELIAQGFRRSGNSVYAPYCDDCTACLPCRIPVKTFHANRAQKRCLKKNALTQACIKSASFQAEHYAMYMRYQKSRHCDSSMAQSSEADYIDFLSSDWSNTQFVEFKINNELAGLAVIDNFTNALSAVYTFFEPKFAEYSLGTYSILWQIEQAKLHELEFVYLGFWIKECQKMRYKINYKPLQCLINKQWIEV